MLADIFRVPNNGVRRGPIKVLGQSCKGSFRKLCLWLVITIHIFPIDHFNPINSREKRAQGITVCPSTRIIARPNVPHPGPPPSDLNVCIYLSLSHFPTLIYLRRAFPMQELL